MIYLMIYQQQTLIGVKIVDNGDLILQSIFDYM